MDLRGFLEPCYRLAYKTLTEQGELSPFGVAQRQSGDLQAFLSENGSIASIRQELKAGLTAGELAITALVCDATLEHGSDAAEFPTVIAFYLDRPPQWSRLMLVPYQLTKTGRVVLGRTDIRANPEPLLAA